MDQGEAVLKFEWDTRKVRANLRKHSVPFEEATSIFGDPLAYTFPDPDHSIREARYLTLDSPTIIDFSLWLTPNANAPAPSASSAPGRRPDMSEPSMSKADDTLRTHYSREDRGAGVRGKYFKRYPKGTNVMLLDDRVARACPTSAAVNDALLSVLALAEKTRPAATRGSRKRTAC